MARATLILLLIAGLSLPLTARDTAEHTRTDHLLRVGFGLLLLQSGAPVAPLRLQQLQQVLSQMPMGASSFSE